MKKLLLTAASILSIATANAQTIAGDDLDINNIKARINVDGNLFWDYMNQKFEVPQGSGKHTIFANALWIGGFDASNTLRIAGQTYGPTNTDYWPGPLDASASTDSATIAAFNKVWKLNQCDIDTYLNWYSAGATGTNPTDPTAMNTILNWPTLNPTGGPLAPYYDNNSNGVYDPYAGDVPKIKGDQAIFFVYNDKGGIHTITGGAAIGVEIQAMIYAYSCPADSALYNTIFANYKIINKSSFALDSTFIGNWTDLDVGSASDDYVGCDVTRGSYYGYNGDLIDDNPPAGQIPYGANPPSQSVTFLAGPYADPNGIDDASTTTPNGTNYGDLVVDNERLGMSKFVYYVNDFSVVGNPSAANDYYNYMAGYWKDATPFTYGGTGHLTGVPADYMFPGTSDPLAFGTNGVPQPAWDETTSGNIPSDRRGLGSYGPFTFQPGAVHEIDFAYVFGRATSGGNLASVAVMNDRIDSVKQKYSSGISGCGCAALTSIIAPSQSNDSFFVYPNPASEIISISFETTSKNVSVKIYDAQGKLVKEVKNILSGETSVSILDLNYGMYLVHLQEDTKTTTKRFIKQ